MKAAQLESIGGIDLPDGIPAVRYTQAQFAAITEHRITCGIGIRDIRPQIDVDLFAGYGFDNEDQFANTTINLDGNYWLGFGTTWRFGGACHSKCESNREMVRL
jgi:long-chain fatty acid transport protein